MFYIDKCKDINEIKKLRTDYLFYLRGPQEAWLEEQVYVRNPDFYVFGYDDQRIGYCCVDLPKRLLLQFYISEEFLQFSIAAFEALLNDKKIKLAYVTTRDPLALSLCLTFQTKVALEAYLFEHCFSTNIELKNISNPLFRLAGKEDLTNIIEVSGDFFRDVESDVNSNNLYLLTESKNILGIGYLNAQYCSGNSANAGMFTNPTFRRRYVGSYILQKLVEECRTNDLLPIAACFHENLASKRTLEKAGFVSYDRTFLVSF
jgi:GNAT superfamily N-acetyltransferase